MRQNFHQMWSHLLGKLFYQSSEGLKGFNPGFEINQKLIRKKTTTNTTIMLENELLATGVHRISMFFVPTPFLKSLYNSWSQ